MTKLIKKIQRKLFLLLKKIYVQIKPFHGVKKTILIVGTQRSGTNLLMDVLERSVKTDVYHEIDKRAFDSYLMKPIADINLLKKNSKAEFFVIKGLCEAQKTEVLLNELSPAKAIWVVRHYNDVINSMNISFKSTVEVFQQIKIDKLAGGWRTENISDQTYQLVKTLVHPGLTNKSASALLWYIRNIIYFEKGYDTNNNIKVLNYNGLVLNPERTLTNINKYTGLSYKPFMSSIINSNSIKKNEEPVIDEEISNLCSNLWERFMQLPSNILLNT